MTYPQEPVNPQQGWGMPPTAPAPEPPKKKSKRWPWVVGAIVAVFVIAGISDGDKETKTGSDSAVAAEAPAAGAAAVGGAAAAEAPAAEAPKPDSAPGLNAPVRDGKFEFTVTEVETGLSSLGDNMFLTKEAQGQFVVVTMTVQNTAKEPKGLSPDNQEMYDTQGRKFTADTSAGLNLDSDVSFYDEINPGNAVTMKVVYDMPAGAVPAYMKLHDSMFSGGARVNLQ